MSGKKKHCIAEQIMENAEINNIIKILGLQYKKNYSDPESLKTLRYGKIMIMTDQVCQQLNLKNVSCIVFKKKKIINKIIQTFETWFEKFPGFDHLLTIEWSNPYYCAAGSRWLPYQRPVDQLHPSQLAGPA